MTQKLYTPVRVSAIRSDENLPFELYVRVAGKYILYIHKNEHLEGERYQKLVDKRIECLFVKQEDHQNFEKFLYNNLDQRYSSLPEKPIERQADIILQLTIDCAERLLNEIDNPSWFQLASKNNLQLLTLLKEQPELLSQIFKIRNVNNNIVHNNVHSALIYSILADELGLDKGDPKQKNLFLITAFVHNIYFYNNPELIVTKPTELPEEKLVEYKKALEKNHMAISPLYQLTEDHSIAIAQHKERITGLGLPNQLKEKQIHINSRCLGLSLVATEYFSKSNNSIKESMQSLLIDKVGEFPLDLLQALQRCLKKWQII